VEDKRAKLEYIRETYSWNKEEEVIKAEHLDFLIRELRQAWWDKQYAEEYLDIVFGLTLSEKGVDNSKDLIKENIKHKEYITKIQNICDIYKGALGYVLARTGESSYIGVEVIEALKQADKLNEN